VGARCLSTEIEGGPSWAAGRTFSALTAGRGTGRLVESGVCRWRLTFRGSDAFDRGPAGGMQYTSTEIGGAWGRGPFLRGRPYLLYAEGGVGMGQMVECGVRRWMLIFRGQ
jgi:hypothetical protein